MSLFSELKRRNVFRVAIAYTVIAWLLAQVADLAFDNFGTPEWVSKTILFLLVLGFPLAIFFAWAFELTPEGLKKEKDVVREASITAHTGRKLDYSIIVLLVIALGYFVWESRIADRSLEVDQATEQVAAATAEDAVIENDKSIAVLPFDNRSSREEDEFFTEGIHDDLLTTIAKIGSMKVISRTSVMAYKDTTKNIREIAKELGVANILEGGVQRSGNQVRINVQLIDAATDRHLWAEIYDRELTAENIFSIQSEISKAIADALQATLSPEEQEKLEVVHTHSLEAYESYLLGRKLWTARTADSNAESVKHFQHAIDLDPAYALAYVGLSDAYRFKVYYEGADPGDVFPLARRALETALQINDQLGEAYASLGTLKRNARDYSGADADFRRAIELSPNHLPSYNWYALSLGYQGRNEEALAMYRKGLALDPLSAVLRSNVGYQLFAVGRFDEARKSFERSIAMHPTSGFGYSGYAVYHAGVRGRIDDAALWMSNALEVDPTDAGTMGFLAFMYLTLGDSDTAEQWLDQSIVAQPDNGSQKVTRLSLLILRDNKDERDEAEELANDVYAFVNETNEFAGLSLSYLRDIDIANGRYDEALQRYATIFPEIVSADEPGINRANFYAAVEIAYLHIRSGEAEQGRQLLEAVIPVIDTVPILSVFGSAWGNAQTYALLGRTDEALAELQRGVNAGWRMGWRYAFDHDPIFESLRHEPEFAAMRAEIATDMAEQLRNVRELEASGEILRPEALIQTSSLQSAASL
jgi:TolB-like protein/Tfp pilus assembly protein PilF